MSDRRILVVGTTPDYIAYIHEHYPNRALFLTDQSLRLGSAEVSPDESSEVVCNLSSMADLLDELLGHLKKRDQSLSGIACYDCEWLTLAAELAKYFNLPFPSVEAVRLSRDKYRSKKIWADLGVRCPEAELVYSAGQALKLCESFGGPVVLKPLTGSGSELTFRCDNLYDLAAAYRTLIDGLAQRSESPMYRLDPEMQDDSLPASSIMAEEFINGREYSADFIIADNKIRLIRLAKKITDDTLPFGTTMAYMIPAQLPGWLNYELLCEKIYDAANALGLTRAVCMMDFKITRDEIVLLELTPRIGGDCLPPLIRKSCGLDTIGLALDFAEGKEIIIPPPAQWTELIGMRLFSVKSGRFTGVSYKDNLNDSRIAEIFIKRRIGHEIIAPPDDYDSWVLGYVIFEPEPDKRPREQCNDIREKISINVEQYYDQKCTRIVDENNRAV